jgi:hypothetical protein
LAEDISLKIQEEEQMLNGTHKKKSRQDTL